MSVFALNLRFDLEQSTQRKGSVKQASTNMSLKSTERAKYRTGHIQEILKNQQVHQKEQQSQRDKSLILKILSEQQKQLKNQYDDGMNEQERLYYQFLKIRRQKRNRRFGH